MGVVLHYSIFFVLYMHSLRICFGCLDGKFFSFQFLHLRLVVLIIFGSPFLLKTERQKSEKYILFPEITGALSDNFRKISVRKTI